MVEEQDLVLRVCQEMGQVAACRTGSDDGDLHSTPSAVLRRRKRHVDHDPRALARLGLQHKGTADACRSFTHADQSPLALLDPGEQRVGHLKPCAVVTGLPDAPGQAREPG